MRKVSRSRQDLDMLPEYDFSKGVRGKYAIWAPLMDFHWSGLEWQVTDDTWIRPGAAYRDYEKFDEFKFFLSEEELHRCQGAGHRLALVHSGPNGLSRQAKINSFLLALWIVRPTRTHVPFRFEVEESGTRSVARLLDRFQWVRGQVEDEIKDEHLRKVAGFLPSLRTAYNAERRLRNALALSFRGCVSSDWQSAFICFAAAAEAILTYSNRPGLTDRLAKSYAKLVGSAQVGNESAYDRFERLYSVRSDIIHGRAYGRRTASQNLSDLADFSDLLRQLWRVVLESPKLRAALEGDDRQRQSFFLMRR